MTTARPDINSLSELNKTLTLDKDTSKALQEQRFGKSSSPFSEAQAEPSSCPSHNPHAKENAYNSWDHPCTSR